jgi:hypothetical protein
LRSRCRKAALHSTACTIAIKIGNSKITTVIIGSLKVTR